MSIYRHVPEPPLNQYVEFLWYYHDLFLGHDREHVLPEGTFELIINLEDRPRRLFDRQNPNRHQTFRRGWLSGVHAEYLVIDAVPGSSMIGAHFKPGGAAPFLGLPAGELCGSVLEMDTVWDNRIWEWRDRILEATSPESKLKLVEQLLLRRLKLSPDPADRRRGLAWALNRFLEFPSSSSCRRARF